MTRPGVVAAFDREARLFAEGANPAARRESALITFAGIGALPARTAGERLLADGATALLSWGVATALDRDLPAGSLLVPKTIVAANLHEYPADADWHRQLCESLNTRFVVHEEPLAESREMLSTLREKRALMLHTGAIAADMESAAVAALAREAGVPFAAIRAVSDAASARVPPWLRGAIDGAGRLSVVGVVKQLALRPGDWAAISRLAIGFRAARMTLIGVAERVRAGRTAAA